MRECYIDSIPSLVSCYTALGFSPVGKLFLHRENGPSQPMVLDVTAQAERLGRDWSPTAHLRLMARARSEAS
ncbi:MAG: hypothetical protein U0Q12_18920 [Vicinamibacterales bacterium]